MHSWIRERGRWKIVVVIIETLLKLKRRALEINFSISFGLVYSIFFLILELRMLFDFELFFHSWHHLVSGDARDINIT
jgi:hypothetical protein